MEEIPNNHLGCRKAYVNTGINHQPQLISKISSINHQHVQVPKMEESSYKLYGYGLCKGTRNTHPK